MVPGDKKSGAAGLWAELRALRGFLAGLQDGTVTFKGRTDGRMGFPVASALFVECVHLYILVRDFFPKTPGTKSSFKKGSEKIAI